VKYLDQYTNNLDENTNSLLIMIKEKVDPNSEDQVQRCECKNL